MSKERRSTYVAVFGGLFLVATLVTIILVLPVLRGSPTGEWSTQQIAGSALSLTLPGPLTPTELELPPEVKRLTSSFSTSSYDSDGVYVGVTHGTYLPTITASLEGAISGALANMARQAKNAKLTQSQRAIVVDGRPGAVVEFQLVSLHETMAGHGLFLTEANQAWQVIVLHKPEHTTGPQLAERIFSSAHFEEGRP